MGDSPTVAVELALAVIAAIALIYLVARMCRGRRDGFASQRAHAVYQSTSDLFGRTGGKATFSEFKSAVPPPIVDAVVYDDARKLWKQGTLSPETVEKIL